MRRDPDDDFSIDVEVFVHHTTHAAMLVSLIEPDGKTVSEKVWLPLSQIEAESTDSNETTTVSIPEWLAIDKGLI